MTDDPNAGWTLITLKALMDERDKRYQQRFESSQKAIDETKAENLTRFSNTNEWRDALKDREADFARKSELNPVNEQLRKCVTKSEVVALVSIIGIILGALFEVLNFLSFQHK